MAKQRKLFCFGLGYSAYFLAKLLQESDVVVAGTSRTQEKSQRLQAAGIEPYLYSDEHALVDAKEVLAGSTHILISVPPNAKGCPVFTAYKDIMASLPDLVWVGYLSTTGVYGDHNGAWVDESTPPNPPRESAKWRLIAEKQWMQAYDEQSVPAHIFRLSGIYGPQRNILTKLTNKDTDYIVKLDDPVSRIHVEDIAHILYASMEQCAPGEIYNVADDEPIASYEVATYAASLMNVVMPPLKRLEELSEEQRSAQRFFGANRRIDNTKIKTALGVELLYPSFREGLKAIAQEYEVGTILAYMLRNKQ